MKVTVSPRVRLTPLERIDLIVFPSVLKRRVEIGLYSVRAHVELWYSAKEWSDLIIHLPVKVATRKNRVAVIRQKASTSSNFYHGFRLSLLRSLARYVLVVMNSAPRHPPAIPMIIAPGSSLIEITSWGFSKPNFRVDASDRRRGPPF